MEPDIWHSIIRGLAMLARFLAGAACAAGVLAAVCTPAAAQSFFSSMFGSWSALSVVFFRNVRVVDRALGRELSGQPEAGHHRDQHAGPPPISRAGQRPGPQLRH